MEGKGVVDGIGRGRYGGNGIPRGRWGSRAVDAGVEEEEGRGQRMSAWRNRRAEGSDGGAAWRQAGWGTESGGFLAGMGRIAMHGRRHGGRRWRKGSGRWCGCFVGVEEGGDAGVRNS